MIKCGVVMTFMMLTELTHFETITSIREATLNGRCLPAFKREEVIEYSVIKAYTHDNCSGKIHSGLNHFAGTSLYEALS